MEPDKLAAELADRRRKLFSLQSQTVTEKVEDNTQFGKIKRDIARILTIQRERLLQAEPGRTRPARAAKERPAAKAPAAKPAPRSATTSKAVKPRGRAKARAAAR
jgi:large subunit ribosomal protein L29